MLGYWGVGFMAVLPRIDESSFRITRRLLAFLWIIALVSRVVAAFLLPNAEQDGYSYAETIEYLTNQFETAQFHVHDLYGFWLPAFQFGSALINLLVHQPLIAGKVVNVLSGATSVVLVFLITRMVTGSLSFSLLAFGLILFSPLHMLYSASCMTDVPHACMVLASLWFALRRRWLGAGVFAAIAEGIRIESWALIPALPVLQWLLERRVSWRLCLILLLPPLAWLFVAFASTGSPFAYFAERARYHAEYMQFHPERQGFHWTAVEQDVGSLLGGAGRVVFAAALLATITTFARLIRTSDRVDDRMLAPAVYGAGMLGLLGLAYLTKSQPVWLPRYGLIFLAIGLPLFAKVLQWIVRNVGTRLATTAVVIALIGPCLIEMFEQISTLTKVRQDFRAHQQIAARLVNNVKTAPRGARCFSDDVAVRVLSRLPVNSFLRSPFVPAMAAGNAENFSSWLRGQNVKWLVFFPTEDSIPMKLFPQLAKAGGDREQFHLIAFAHSTFGPDIWLYQVR